MLNKIATLVLASTVISGCSSPQDATDKNFLQAIAKYQDQQDACFNAPGSFPFEIAKNDRTFEKKTAILNELAKAGLLKTEEVQVKQIEFFGTGGQMTEGLRYSATEQAEPFMVVSDRPSLFTGAQFCYGDYKAVAVKSFTEPADMMGQKISRVIYTYQLADAASWAKNSAILQEQIPSLAKDIGSLSTPLERESVLILTNEGWVHEKLFKAGS